MLLTIDPKTPVLGFSPTDIWTVSDAFEGTQIFGATGSGKTSASGAAIQERFLKLGFGGLVLTVKNDDREQWTNPKWGACARANRMNDLIILEKNGAHVFDFLEYELQRKGPGAGETAELARLFSTVLESEGKGSTNNSDPYWNRAMKQLLTNAIEFSRLATGRVSLTVLSTVVHEAPLSHEETQAEDWQALVRAARASAKTDIQKRDLDMTLNYFNREFPRLNDKTRSSIISVFTSMADDLLRGVVGQIFSGGKFSFTPEDSHAGKIILIDLPVKEHGDVGRFAQMLVKYIWQRAAERRDKNSPMRPLFLWSDESQELLTAHDATFQTSARSSAVATVYLTQNKPNYHAKLGSGQQGEAATDSLLGNLVTKIFHANGDPTTNEWAERVIGKKRQSKSGGSVSDGKTTTNWGEITEPAVPAREFTMLRKGGIANGRQVDGIIFQTGRIWEETGENYIRAVFEQPPAAR